ncbi:hypothetical protein [Clostridium sp. HMP27]|uniref:hypothetical protein n=1 Tax=Clostridium sp. HMP27 TaxID=1487921 RepID=UPI00052D4F97|nr:hypothetical protein [Clostridium sp. HMP27]KGK81143.1 hypothetical protein DP68_18515 [Clostridium sp. HMP27]
MELVLFIFIASMIGALIYIIIKKEKHIWYVGLKYEFIARKIHKCLLKKDQKLSIEKAKPIIYSIIEEKWFMSLKKEQIYNLIYRIEVYLNQNNEDISEFGLKTLVNKFRQDNRI